MAIFYCVGFHDLSHAWNNYGHVQNHEIFMNLNDAEQAKKGTVLMVHEFYVRDALFEGIINRLKMQHKNFIESFNKK